MVHLGRSLILGIKLYPRMMVLFVVFASLLEIWALIFSFSAWSFYIFIAPFIGPLLFCIVLIYTRTAIFHFFETEETKIFLLVQRCVLLFLFYTTIIAALLAIIYGISVAWVQFSGFASVSWPSIYLLSEVITQPLALGKNLLQLGLIEKMVVLLFFGPLIFFLTGFITPFAASAFSCSIHGHRLDLFWGFGYKFLDNLLVALVAIGIFAAAIFLLPERPLFHFLETTLASGHHAENFIPEVLFLLVAGYAISVFAAGAALSFRDRVVTTQSRALF